MRRRLALRRFPHEVIRRRQGPGDFNDYGEYVEGGIVTAILPASIQPLSLTDTNTAAGVSLLSRQAVYVPVGIERVVGDGDVLTWGGDVLEWNGEPLQWGGFSGYQASSDSPLQAAFDDRGADEVEIAGTLFVVEESQLWRGSHCRAVLLRET